MLILHLYSDELWACGRTGMFSKTNMYCKVLSLPCMKVASTDLHQTFEKAFAGVALDPRERVLSYLNMCSSPG